MANSLRLVHVSDVHVTQLPSARRGGEFAPKRLAGFAAGVVTGRRRLFSQAGARLDAFARQLAADPPDLVAFSGDATTLALPGEFAAAAEALGVGTQPGLAVPGNHDRYVVSAGALFEAHFAPWQLGERLPGHDYPFAARAGACWLIALDSARPNWRVTDSTGAFGRDQLDRLRALCATLGPGPRVLVTHYPPARADGQLEGKRRRLADWFEATRAARDCGVKAWLHGHIHTGFVAFPTAAIPFARLCAGSLTQKGRLSYGDYSLSEAGLDGVRKQYDPRAKRFRPAETFRIRW